MKKIFSFTILALIFSLTISPIFGNAQSLDSKNTDKTFNKDIKEIQEALKNNEIEIDFLNGEKINEKTLYNQKGKEIGVLGIEEIENKLDQDLITPFVALPTNGTTKTFKVYWNAVTVSYQFYVDVKLNTAGRGVIVRAYDPWKLVIWPGVLASEKLSVIQTTETASIAAEARYTLKFSAPVTTTLWINGKVKNGNFSTGFN